MSRVFIDGKEVAADGPIKGMFLRHNLEITQHIAQPQAKECSLAVLVRPPDHVGCVDKG